MPLKYKSLLIAIAVVAICVPPTFLMAQADQGSITGVVQDTSGAVIGNASVTLTSLDMGQVLKAKTDSSGVYVFSPIKIGNYSITVGAPGFETTTRTNLRLSLQQRLSVNIALKPGSTTETVTVTSEEPLMQTQESSVGQTMDAQTINSIPIVGGNWLYIAQLAAGVAPPVGSRGNGKGDFNANGQRAEQNNFILDGVDNNVNVVDFYNGASYAAQPPTDALAEFKLQTSDYSAEFGHSAGSVVNASMKSGTNNIHGSAWEYLRNTIFDAHDWNAGQLPLPPYHQNLFGATLGLPIIRNKLFLFADAQANRVAYSETSTMTVPSLLERTGDFSELFDPSLTGAGGPIQLYHQTADAAPVAFPTNNLASDIPGVTPNAKALAILNLYPKPNTNNGLLYSNNVVARPAVDNTFQWDLRMDWNISGKDTAYSRFSYWNEVGNFAPPLGPILDGGGFGDDGKQKDLAQNFMLSETHVFNPTLTNEFRFGYNYMHTGFNQASATNAGLAASLGFGGIPGGALNGGLPNVSFSANGSASGIATFGGPQWSPTDEHENVFQILDNVTKIAGNHSLKAGVNFQSVRFSTLQPNQSRGSYYYSGEYTSNMNANLTGYGLADFVLDSMYSAGLTNMVTTGNARWYDAVYAQDDWRITHRITINAGLRWDYFQPYKEVGGGQASYHMTGPATLDTNTGQGSGSAQYQIPNSGKSYAQAIFQQTGNLFPNLLATDNIALVYTSDPHIVKAQHTNFAPRLGIAYSPNAKTVIRAGYGIFYGGLESTGYYPNLGQNYPFQYAGNFPSASCFANYCPTNGITIASGFTNIIAGGFANDVSYLTLRGSDPNAKTPYTEDYNLSLQQSITNNFVATISYVGNSSHHLQAFPDPNNPQALENPNNSVQSTRPLPDFGSSAYTAYSGNSNYNALQAKLEKRFSRGYSLLATYTWSHAFDDAVVPLGSHNEWAYRQSTLIPIKMDYSNSPFDTRQRFTFEASYKLPFGSGHRLVNHAGILDTLFGGWSVNTTFVAQTGNPFTVQANIYAPSGAGPYAPFAVKIKDPFAAGGTNPNPNMQVTCASRTRTRQNWYNPCAFMNPWDSNDPTNELNHYIPTGPDDPNCAGGCAQPVYVTSTASAIGFLGGKRDDVYGPGYERVNMSIFKAFKVYSEHTLQFRADIFNLFNTPSLDIPYGDYYNDSAGGLITGPRSFQSLTPDARFFQLSLKYTF
jgi:hypothetical protein